MILYVGLFILIYIWCDALVEKHDERIQKIKEIRYIIPEDKVN